MGAFSISDHEFEAWTDITAEQHFQVVAPINNVATIHLALERRHCAYADWVPRWTQLGLKKMARSSKSGNASLPRRLNGY